MTQTILLTDVEGSTRLWQEDPEWLGRHDEIVGRVIAAHDGTLLKERGEGDSVFATFDRAQDGVAAARDVQLEFWPGLRVRIALHIGEPEGPDVNRCARLRSLAHGGQVLVTLACVAALKSLPQGITLQDLGFHPLRDFDRPERVFQLCHADLPDEFAPITPPPNVAHVAELAERVRRDVSALGIGAACLGLSASIALADDARRAEFLRDLQSVFAPLAEKYAPTPDAAVYQLTLVCYPSLEGET
jgi:hypothetical protein